MWANSQMDLLTPFFLMTNNQESKKQKIVFLEQQSRRFKNNLYALATCKGNGKSRDAGAY